MRDYLGNTQVNADILKTLADDAAPDFWWLNNGVTILATDATVVGKTINLVDIQIVNGLQTTESVYRHFWGGGRSTGSRSLLIKIVVSKDVTHRDRIIQATNNQNVVETAGLRASDKVQRDIEEFLEQHGWYYERRRNYYKNIGKPQERFVTPMYLASGFVSLLMKNPSAGSKLRAKFMRKDVSYATVFSDRQIVNVWLAITEVFKRVEAGLRKVRLPGGGGERFLAGWRSLIAFMVVSRLIGRYSYSVADLIKLDYDTITVQLVGEVWGVVMAEMGEVYKGGAAKKSAFVAGCCLRAATQYGITDIEVVGKRQVSETVAANPDKAALKAEKKKRRDERKQLKKEESDAKRFVSTEIVNRVNAALPQQPWKPGIHNELAAQISLDPKDVSAAIGRLIRLGLRFRQRDGVVYGADGKIIASDTARSTVATPPAAAE